MTEHDWWTFFFANPAAPLWLCIGIGIGWLWRTRKPK